MINDAQAVQDQFDHVDLSALNRAQRYKLLTGAVIPRPIAFVTTLGPDGIVNAAPFSQFVILAVDPGLLGVSIGPRDGGRKDTLVNIEASREFVRYRKAGSRRCSVPAWIPRPRSAK